MAALPPHDVTELLAAWHEGDQGAFDRLVPLVYAELRRIAHRGMREEHRGHILQTTALVHEAYIRLIDATKVRWESRAHFYAICAHIMRRVLVDAARERGARKRGGGWSHETFDEAQVPSPERGGDLVELDGALQVLEKLDSRRSQVVELRFFGGLSVLESAKVLGVSPETVARDWRVAKLWLLKELGSRSARSAARPA